MTQTASLFLQDSTGKSVWRESPISLKMACCSTRPFSIPRGWPGWRQWLADAG